jgi:hypothetical protein
MPNLQHSYFYTNKWLDGWPECSQFLYEWYSNTVGKIVVHLGHTTAHNEMPMMKIRAYISIHILWCSNWRNPTRSEEKIIQYGVPQGSILGPLLLLIYINDINTNTSNDIHIKLTLFSDDTSTVITSNDRQDLTFSLDRINGSILPWFDKTDWL